MNSNSIHVLVIALLFAFSGMTTNSNAQDAQLDKSVKQIPSANKHSEQKCFASGDPIVDNMPKRDASKREQQIIDKIINVVTLGYGSQQAAFSDLDSDHNCQLDKSEVSGLLKKSKVSRFLRVIASGRLIDRYDVSHDGYVQWREFHFAIDKALVKAKKSK